MTTRNSRIRICDNNLAASDSATLTASSAQAGFPLSNLTDSYRFRRWKPSGQFTITATNQTLYINDGADKTVSVLTGSGLTGAALASSIQSALNLSSTNWTVSYDTDTYKFTIGRSSGTATLRLSETSNAMWDTLGYTGTADVDAGTGLEADALRIHTSEYVDIDLGVAQACTFFAWLGRLGQTFSLTDSATVTLYGNTTSDMTSPALTVSLTPTANGIYKFMDDLTDTTYRYWRAEFIDKDNPAGPLSFEFGHMYLGDYVTIERRNVATGLQRTDVDSSVSQESAGGALFFRRGLKYSRFGQAEINYLDASDRYNLEQALYDLGKSTPFYVSFDPTLAVSDDIGEYTRYVVLEDDPVWTHIKADVYSVSLSFREVM